MTGGPKLLVRADGGPSVGAGHLMRCLALAQAALERGGGAVFLTNQGSETALGRRLLAEGCAVDPITEPDPPGVPTRSLAALDHHRPDALVVDGYGFDSNHQAHLHKATRARGIPLLWVDDQAHAAPYVADLVLNQNPHATPEVYARRASHTRLLLGPSHALLRREFRSIERDEAGVGPVRRILVTLGGGDADNVTARVLAGMELALEDLEPKPRVEVVVGALNPHYDQLRPLAERAGFELKHDVRDMARTMGRADLALTAAGSTCWELAYLGLPALVVSLADNQRPLAHEVARWGSAVDLGWHGDLEPETVARETRALLEDPERRLAMARRGRERIDGHGAERVLLALDRVKETFTSHQGDLAATHPEPSDTMGS